MEQLPLHLEVFETVDDRVGRDNSQGGVVAVAIAAEAAVADIHVDPQKGYPGVVVIPIVGQEEEAPVSSFVPCLGSMCLYLDWVVEEEPRESTTAV